MNSDIPIRDFILLCYYAYEKTMRGKTYLQKIIYFISVFFGNTETLRYKPHYYGPYSPLVDSENDKLKSLGFISENQNCFGGCDRFGNEITRYDFCITENGRKIAELKISNFSEEWKAINSIVSKIKATKELDYYALSIAAKSYFILLSERKPLKNIEITKIAKKFDWKIKDDEINNAIEFLKNIDLVQTSKD